jgi:hypothetical protein
MTNASRHLVLLLGVAFGIGCAGSVAPNRPPVAGYPYPGAYPPYAAPYPSTAYPYAAGPSPVAPSPPPPPVGSPLPAGWAWPVNAQAIALGLAQAVYRPVNVQALQALAGSGPCAPVEVAPSIWIAPMCAKPKSLSLSPHASGFATTPATASGPTPSSVDLRALGLDGPVKDQQQAGVCWSFAISTLMDNGLRRAGRTDVLAPLHIIADDEFQLLFDQGAGRPLVVENSWAYDPHKACKLDDNSGDKSFCAQAYNIQAGSWRSDPVLVAERTRAEASGVYRIVAFRSLAHNPANPDEIARVLATGQAVYAGFDVDLRAWSSMRQQPGAVLADWQPDGSGGHAVALVGYRTAPTGRQFLVHNSWGKGWGDAGYAWVTEAMVRDRLHEAFVVTVGDSAGALPMPTPAPTPTPAPSTTSNPTTNPFPFPLPAPAPTTSTSACPPNTVRDLLLARCVAPCAGGVAPVAGVCPVLAVPPAKTPSCAAGSLADLVTGQCEPACPSGRARAAGVCFF